MKLAFGLTTLIWLPHYWYHIVLFIVGTVSISTEQCKKETLEKIILYNINPEETD